MSTTSTQLAGKTLTVTTTKNLDVEEIVELVRTAFGGTLCRTCTSGGWFTLRQEEVIQPEALAKLHATATLGPSTTGG
jgi:hypothetical protein